MTDETPGVVQLADGAYESIRAINHITGGAMPAPTLYRVLGNLKNVGHLMPQALNQLGSGLQLSLDKFDVYEDDSAVSPEESVAAARAFMDEAAKHAAQVGVLLEKAQSAISGQGHRTQ